MKKNLLTLMFVLAFICVGVSVASAKNSSSSKNSVSESKATVNKIKALRAVCNTDCGQLLAELQTLNENYEASCAPTYFWLCQRATADTLIDMGNEYNANCANYPVSVTNVDRNINRNKLAIDRTKLVRKSIAKFKV
jgi:hypothetical protein